MRPQVVGTLGLAFASVLLLLFNGQRPVTQYRDYRPSAAEIWSTASQAAESAVSAAAEAASSASEVAAGAVNAVSDVASVVVDEASNVVSSALSSSPAAIDETASAIAGFQNAIRDAPLPHAAVAAAATSAADSALPAGEIAAVSATGTATVKGCNRDHSKPLSPEDMLCRVPKGELAFVALANAAYGELAVNWALLLLPVLQKFGHADRAVLAALDRPGLEQFTARRLPTMSTEPFGGIGFNKKHNGHMDGFRWETGAFRAYGVTKAEVRRDGTPPVRRQPPPSRPHRRSALSRDLRPRPRR